MSDLFLLTIVEDVASAKPNLTLNKQERAVLSTPSSTRQLASCAYLVLRFNACMCTRIPLVYY